MGFDGWGGLVNYWGLDDTVPGQVAAIEGVPLDIRNSIIYERGALEFNGSDTVIASWPVFSDRNPGLSQAQAEAAFMAAFGVSQIIWLQEEVNAENCTVNRGNRSWRYSRKQMFHRVAGISFNFNTTSVSASASITRLPAPTSPRTACR